MIFFLKFVDLVEITEIEETKREEGVTQLTESQSDDSIREHRETLPLMFTRILENREATTNQTVEFNCEITQSGIDIVWLRNGQPLSLTEGRYQITSKNCSYYLVIPNVTTDDVGEYTIKAGEIQSTAVLTVNGWYT